MIIYNLINFTNYISSKIANYCIETCKAIIISYIDNNIINKNSITNIECIQNKSLHLINNKISNITNCLCKCINETAFLNIYELNYNITSDEYIYYSNNIYIIFYLFIIIIILLCCPSKKSNNIRNNYSIPTNTNIPITIETNNLPEYNEIDLIENNDTNIIIIENKYDNNKIEESYKYLPPHYNEL